MKKLGMLLLMLSALGRAQELKWLTGASVGLNNSSLFSRSPGFSTFGYNFMAYGAYAFSDTQSLGAALHFDFTTASAIDPLNGSLNTSQRFSTGISVLFRQHLGDFFDRFYAFYEAAAGIEKVIRKENQIATEGAGFRLSWRPGVSIKITDKLRAEIRAGELLASLTRFSDSSPGTSGGTMDFNLNMQFRPSTWKVGLTAYF